MASVLGFELHHPNMSMLWGHRYRYKRKKEINKEGCIDMDVGISLYDFDISLEVL